MDETKKRIMELAGTVRATDILRSQIEEAERMVNEPVGREMVRLLAEQKEEANIRRLLALSPTPGQLATEHARAIVEGVRATLSKDADRFAKFVRPDSLLVGDILNGTASYLSDHLQLAQRYAPMVFADGLEKAIAEAMRHVNTPWLNPDDPWGSVTAFADLQAMVQAVRTLPPFGDVVTVLFRESLGDWRDPITFPSEVYEDPVARAELYMDHGMDGKLVEFPDEAFSETVAAVGLHVEVPIVIAGFSPPVPPEEQANIELMADVYKWLLALETQIRAFIHNLMVPLHGENWPKQRAPKDVREDWEQKREIAVKAGAKALPLISYAEFPHYEKIICRSDNFREIFAPHFGRPEEVRESLQRLYPIRNATMHGRYVTREDQLYVYAEVTRLSKAWTRH